MTRTLPSSFISRTSPPSFNSNRIAGIPEEELELDELKLLELEDLLDELELLELDDLLEELELDELELEELEELDDLDELLELELLSHSQ